MKYKVRIKNEEHSKRMQEWGLENGFKWRGYETNVKHLDKSFLYFEKGYIKYGIDPQIFNNNHFIEIIDPRPQSIKYKIY
jgi:hypothetical protein